MLTPGLTFTLDLDMIAYRDMCYIKFNSKNKKLRLRNIKKTFYRLFKKDKYASIHNLSLLVSKIKELNLISDDKAEELMKKYYVGKSLYSDKIFKEYEKIYEYLWHKICGKCKNREFCDFYHCTPMNCPIIRYKYGDDLKEINDFNIDTFDPLKFYCRDAYEVKDDKNINELNYRLGGADKIAASCCNRKKYIDKYFDIAQYIIGGSK